MIVIVTTLLVLVLSTIWDLKTRRIPNFITLSSITLAFAFNTYYSGLGGLKDTFSGMSLGILLLLLPFALQWMGAGDVKLLAAIGALNGPAFVFFAFLYSAIAGGILAVFYALIRKRFFEVLSNVSISFQGLGMKALNIGGTSILTSGLKFPYGAAFLIGTMVTYWMR